MSENRTNVPSTIPLDDTQKPNIKVYKNGAVFDMDKGRIVAMKPELAVQNTQITKENTGEMLARRVSRKQQLLETAANEAVERMDLKNLHGSDAWIAEIGYHMQKKATNIDDPKMVDAARFLFTETGIGAKAQIEQRSANDPVGQALYALVQFMTAQVGNVVEGEVTPIRSDLQAGTDEE